VSYISKFICINPFVIKIKEIYSQILNSYLKGDNDHRRYEKNHLMFQVKIIFITRFLRNKEIQFVGKTCRH